MKLYKYGMKHRGFSIGCQPAGTKYYEDCNKEKTGFWSYIYYEKPLDDELIKKYELEFISVFGGD